MKIENLSTPERIAFVAGQLSMYAPDGGMVAQKYDYEMYWHNEDLILAAMKKIREKYESEKRFLEQMMEKKS